MFADAVPDACGANVTVKEAVLPAASVKGNDRPLTKNSEPLTPTDETGLLDSGKQIPEVHPEIVEKHNTPDADRYRVFDCGIA